MTNDQLTAILAERILGWKVCPDRFMTSGRHWLSHWRFKPVQRMADAVRLLEQAAPEDYAIGATENGGFRAMVRIAGVTGEARESSQAQALTFAIARAIGLKVDATE